MQYIHPRFIYLLTYLMANRKFHMRFRLAPISMILDDLEML